ncbi:MAG: LCP family protein required for cell wall assembly [Oceanicoccus sp.]|jgi:LCP family protein required for cell wall assembly
MELPDYNVLHIGPEHDHPMDHAIVKAARKTLISRMFIGASIGVVFLALLIYHQTITRSLGKNESYITTLIDEVGTISQDNFILSEKLNSQEAVLQSIETEFSGVLDAITGAGGDASVIEGIFGELFTGTELNLNLTEDVVLATDDDTFDLLILGTNGAHTDTIMVASINESKELITLISVPRDLYLNGRRINAYYTYYGVDQLERMVQSVTGLEIDKYVQVDLDGFVEVVDIVGGIDVEVTEDIEDWSYPNSKGGYDPYSISAGVNHMSGEDALKYARSRKSTSDFDRAARQQGIIDSLRTKVVQLDSVMEMKELTELFQASLAYTDTDVSLLDGVSYYYDYQDFDLQSGLVLSTSNYLYSMINESGAYILLPNTGNFEEIHGVIAELVN